MYSCLLECGKRAGRCKIHGKSWVLLKSRCVYSCYVSIYLRTNPCKHTLIQCQGMYADTVQGRLWQQLGKLKIDIQLAPSLKLQSLRQQSHSTSCACYSLSVIPLHCSALRKGVYGCYNWGMLSGSHGMIALTMQSMQNVWICGRQVSSIVQCGT